MGPRLLERRTFLGLLAALPALGAVLEACGDDGRGSGGDGGDGDGDDGGDGAGTVHDVVRADLARTDVDPALAVAAVAALDAFGADLHRALVAGAGASGNLVFSPASILLALAMTRAGARGATAAEMDAVLHVADPDSFHPAVNAMSRSLEAQTRTVDIGARRPVDVVLRIANSLWAQAGTMFHQEFLDLLATDYGAGIELVDYRRDAEAARRAINGWVSDQTEERIPELLAAGVLDARTRLTLVNAVYMKAQWLETFPDGATADAAFHRPDGSSVQAPTMRAQRRMAYATGDGWQAVELPYAGDGLAMLLVLPAGELAALEESLPAALPERDALRSQEVRLALPRWDIETSTSLRQVLSALGMPTAFSDAADFGGMTDDEPLQIADVVHQANITVDEEGTEAAAATAVVMRATGAPMPQDPVELTFDRPFLFAIRDTETGAVLFQGRITDPTATR